MKKIIKTLLLILVFNPDSFAESEFNKYKEEFMKGIDKEVKKFIDYKKEIKEEFEIYKKITYQEFENFKEELNKIWDKPEMFSKEKFIEYSPNLKEKKVVDFKNGTIKISVINNNKKEAVKRIKKNLQELLKEDKKTAYKKDFLIQRIERKIQNKNLQFIKKEKLNNQPIISDIILKKSTQQEVNKFIKNKFKENKIKVIENKKTKGEKIYTFEIKFKNKNLLKKVDIYKSTVNKFSKKFKIPNYLIFAVIHTESYFNPYAKSPIPAYGLMQIVPFSAGKDVTKFLYGKSFILSPSYLFNDYKNIEAGTAYLYLINNRYLRKIKNPESRIYCAIASYNTGIGNMARAFVGTTNLRKAIIEIKEIRIYLVEKLKLKE